MSGNAHDVPPRFSSVDRKARMALESRGLSLRPAHERLQDFDEVVMRLDEDWAMYEAQRCIHCPDPRPVRRPARRQRYFLCSLAH